MTEIAQNRNDRAPAPDGGDDNHQDDGVPENGQEDNENNRGTKKAKTKVRIQCLRLLWFRKAQKI